MVNEVLDRQLARLRTRLAKTPLPGFFSWWGTQLVACLPPRLRNAISARSDTLLLEERADALVVWREHGTSLTEFGRIATDVPVQTQAQEYRRLRARIDDPNVRTVFCIPADRVLQRKLHMPSAAEDNLRQVLTFEMDRQTPFKADQVYFDSRVTGHDAARNIQVELVLIPRERLDAELAKLAGGNLALDGVDSWRGAPGEARRQINLLPVEQRARRRNMRLPLNLGLLALIVLLVFVNMGESLSNRAAAVEAMRTETEAAAVQARQVAELRKSLADSVAGANFLTEKKHVGPLVVAVLDDISKRLSDDTYLERLSYENGQVQLQGQSTEAAKLIGILGASAYLTNPTFQGQIQPDPRTGKDRFQISAAIKRSSPEAAPAEKSSDAKEGGSHGGA